MGLKFDKADNLSPALSSRKYCRPWQSAREGRVNQQEGLDGRFCTYLGYEVPVIPKSSALSIRQRMGVLATSADSTGIIVTRPNTSASWS